MSFWYTLRRNRHVEKSLSTGGSPPFNPDSQTPTDTNEPYLDWLNFVLAQSSIPGVITTSYGDDEQTVRMGTLLFNSLTDQIMQGPTRLCNQCLQHARPTRYSRDYRLLLKRRFWVSPAKRLLCYTKCGLTTLPKKKVLEVAIVARTTVQIESSSNPPSQPRKCSSPGCPMKLPKGPDYSVSAAHS